MLLVDHHFHRDRTIDPAIFGRWNSISDDCLQDALDAKRRSQLAVSFHIKPSLGCRLLAPFETCRRPPDDVRFSG